MTRLGRWLPLLMIAALLGAAMVATVYGNPTFHATARGVRTQPAPVDQSVPVASAQPTESASSPPANTFPGWLGIVLGSLCLLVLVGLVVGLLWHTIGQRLLERRRVIAVEDPEEARRRVQDEVRAVIDAGLAELDLADSDPRRAVIACWARLEQAAAAAGTPREPGDTSSELVERLLADHAITPGVLAGLAQAYRAARFAPHEIDETMRERARVALRQVRDELGASVRVGEPR